MFRFSLPKEHLTVIGIIAPVGIFGVGVSYIRAGHSCDEQGQNGSNFCYYFKHTISVLFPSTFICIDTNLQQSEREKNTQLFF